MLEGFINSQKIKFVPDGTIKVLIDGNIYNIPKENQENELIRLYNQFDTDAFNHLDGVFNIVIIDYPRNRVLVATDHFTQKPIYYSYQNGFSFANKISLITNKKIDDASIRSFIRFGFIPLEFTVYRDTYKLEGGAVIEIDLLSFKHKIIKYFDIASYYRKQNIDESVALEIVEKAIIRSVDSKIEKDCGVFLSGGIDSSLVAYYASLKQKDIKTFTVSFDGNYDETDRATQTAKLLGTNHTNINIKFDLQNQIKMILNSVEFPFFDSSFIPSFLVAKEAKKHTDIVLNGDGADELFAGYRRFVPIANNWYKYAQKLAFISAIMPKPKDKQSIYNYIFRMLNSAGELDPLKFYAKTRTDITEDILDFADTNQFIKTRNFLMQYREFLPLDQAMIADQKLLLESDLVPKMSIATSVNDLDSRSIFLDKNIAMIASALPNNLKIKGTKTKYILRKLVEKNIDKNLSNLPKRGFEVPLKNWVENDLKNVIRDTITKSNNLWQNYLPKDIADQLISGKLNIDREKRARFLWTLFTLEVWYENNHLS